MASTYLGFDLGGMLWHLHRYCQEASLTKEGDGWRLRVLSEEHGEYETTGSLFYITSQAFKPFVERARAERDEKQRQFRLAIEELNKI